MILFDNYEVKDLSNLELLAKRFLIKTVALKMMNDKGVNDNW